jgi:hypothetical protein
LSVSSFLMATRTGLGSLLVPTDTRLTSSIILSQTRQVQPDFLRIPIPLYKQGSPIPVTLPEPRHLACRCDKMRHRQPVPSHHDQHELELTHKCPARSVRVGCSSPPSACPTHSVGPPFSPSRQAARLRPRAPSGSLGPAQPTYQLPTLQHGGHTNRIG